MSFHFEMILMGKIWNGLLFGQRYDMPLWYDTNSEEIIKQSIIY